MKLRNAEHPESLNLQMQQFLHLYSRTDWEGVAQDMSCTLESSE